MIPGSVSQRQEPRIATLVYALLAVLVVMSAVLLYLAEPRLSAVAGGSTLAVAIPFLAVIPIGCLLFWSARRLQREANRTTERERWLTTTLGSLGDAVVTMDAHGRITFLNRMAEELLGLPETDATGRPLSDVLALRSTGGAVVSPADEALRSGRRTKTNSALELMLRDRTSRKVAATANPVHRPDGSIAGCVLVLQDVTERELADLALQGSQEIFAAITNHISDFVEVLDLQGRRLYTSASFARVLAPGRDLYLTDAFANVHPEDRVRVTAAFQETVRRGHGQRLHSRLIAGDGRVIHVESLASVIRDGSDSPERVLVVSRDDTERDAMEARLRQEKEFSDTLINSLPGIFYLVNRDGTLLRWNRQLERVSGYAADELAALPPFALFPPEFRPLAAARTAECFAHGFAELEAPLVSRDGTQRPNFITGVRLEVDGQPCLLGLAIDISERVRAEDTIRATMRRLGRQNRALSEYSRSSVVDAKNLEATFARIAEVSAETLEVARVGIWLYDDSGTTIRCVELYEQVERRHTAGARLSAREYPAYFEALASQRTIAASDARTDPRTIEFRPHYLEPLGISSLLDAPVRSGGRMVGVICNEHTGAARAWTPDEQNFAGSMADLVSLSLEVHQRLRAEEELREARDHLEIKVAERTRDLAEANERLQELDRLKSEFLATMSHELRTPLNSIIGFTGILRQGLAGPLNEEQLKQLGMVHFSARHLLTLINDLLDLSRIESGKMEVVPDSFALEEVVAEVVQSLGPTVSQKQLRLTSELQPAHLPMQSDRKKVFQILLNLANNAVKFTERGSVTISAHAEHDEVVIAVRDTGIGIKPESIPGLFQAFRQVDGSARRVYEGTGLGLYLCRQLSTMLGGSIRAESEFGVGSRFTVTLPTTLPRP